MTAGPSIRPRTSSTIVSTFNLLLTGSLIAAILSSSCCVGPFVYALFDTAPPRFLQHISSGRPYFIAASAIFFILALVLSHRRTDAVRKENRDRLAIRLTFALNLCFIFSSLLIDRLV